MDKLEMAKALLGTTGNVRNGQTTTTQGVATVDSTKGVVRVNLGGDTVSNDDDQTVEIETTFAVKEGDEVIVSMIGADGTGKTPVVTGVVGRGDEQQEQIDSVKNYFWTDDRGAHVSTEPQSVEGKNVLLDSDSLDIREGASNSESDQTVYASFGREVTVGSRDPDGDVGMYSQVYGRRCVASGMYSKASGFNTIANGSYQTVIGRNNEEDDSDQYALIIGNGSYPKLREYFTTDTSTTSFALSHTPETFLDFQIAAPVSNPLGVQSEADPQTQFTTKMRRFYLAEPLSQDLPVMLQTNDRIKIRKYFVIIPAGEQYSEWVEPYSVSQSRDMEEYMKYYAPYFNLETVPAQYSLAGNVLTLAGLSEYWVTQVSGMSMTVYYEYSGVATRTNAMTVDWNGNVNIAGKLTDSRGTPKLLWENPDSDHNFAEQTIVVDGMENYSLIMITCKQQYSTSDNMAIPCFAFTNSVTQLCVQNIGSTQYFYKRTATISSYRTIEFSTGYRNTTGTASANYCIPLAVYGVF